MNGSAYDHRDGLWARAGNMLVSGWLIVSGFAWEQGAPRTSAGVVGYLVFVFTLLGTTIDDVRVLNTILGIWVIASAWILPVGSAILRVNTTLIGVAIAALSMISKQGELRPPPFRELLARIEPHGAHAR